MSRVGPLQPDLFAPAQEVAGAEESEDPVAALAAMLASVRAAEAPPWPSLSVAMEEEYRAMGLARRAGAEGAALLSAFFEQTERLHAMTD